MHHNVLVLLSARRPAGAADRRALGLPDPGRSGPPPGSFACCRVEGLTPAQVRGLSAAMRRAGGSASPAPPRRNHPALAGLGAPDPARALVLAADGGAYDLFLDRAARVAPTAAAEIAATLGAASAPAAPLRLPDGRRLPADRTLVMGILNVTPDSFSDGGRYSGPSAAVRRAIRMAEEGADIIDVGGESTRPGSAPVPLATELRRVLPVLEGVAAAVSSRRGGGPVLSIDTTKAEVARRAAAAGAALLNDISGMTFDPAMAAIAAEYRLTAILQHIRGRPATMQRAPRYGLLLPEIAAFLRAVVARARRAGVASDRIAVDPGFGFGKGRPHNLALLRHLRVLRSLGHPVLAGASRKSFLPGAGALAAERRLEASLAAEALALAGGADIIRAHDVREAARVAVVCDAVLRATSGIR